MVCVVGIGNELYRDDAVGMEVVRELQVLKLSGKFNFYILENDYFDLPEILHKHEKAIIVDAMEPGLCPGRISVSCFIPGNLQVQKVFSLHEMDLWWQLEAVVRKGYDGQILLVGIETGTIELGFGFSAAIKKAFPGILKRIVKILRKI